MPGLSIFEIPQQPSLGSLLGMGIGQGVQQGVEQHQKLQQTLQLARAKEAAKGESTDAYINKMFPSDIEEQKSSGDGNEQKAPHQYSDKQIEQMATNPKFMLGLAGRNKPLADQINTMYGNILKERKITDKEAADIRKEERGLGEKSLKSWFDQVGEDELKLNDEKLALDMTIDAIKSGEVDPFSSAHIGSIAKAFGAPSELTRIFETPGSKEFKTARKRFITNTIQDAFRGTTSRTEINLAEDMISELGVSKEGNLASAWGMQTAHEIKSQRITLRNKLQEQGIANSKIPALAEKMLTPYVKEIKKEYFEALRELRKKK